MRQPASSRLELFGEYGYRNPSDSNAGHYLQPPRGSLAIAGAAGYFTRFLGVEAEGSVTGPGETPCSVDAEAGPRLRLPLRAFVPYIHILAGGSKLGGPVGQRCTWGWGVTGGGGLDYVLPFGRDHLAARLVEVDYAYSHVMFPHPESALVSGGIVRLSTGLVLRAGAVSAPALNAMSCPVEPANVFAGEPISVTAVTVGGFGKGQTGYRWDVSGGRVLGGGETVTIDTAELLPRDYEVSGKLLRRSSGRVVASCRSSFRVRAPEPPRAPLTLRCAAEPGTLSPGASALITSEVDDPLHRQLTFSYTASAGTVDGTGATAHLTLSPLAAGTVEVSCAVADDLGRTAVFKLTVPIAEPVPPPPPPPVEAPSAPPPSSAPPAPPTLACSIAFPGNPEQDGRLDGSAKACLDALVLRLQAESGARLVLLGHHLPPETPATAAQRTVRSARYLVEVRHVDPAQIEMRTGGDPGQSVQTFVLEPGQVFAAEGSSPIETSSLRGDRRTSRRPGHAAKAARHPRTATKQQP